MINFLSSWVKSLSLSLILVSILEMVLPNNKTKKYVKMVMGLYILFSIVAPFVENNDKLNSFSVQAVDSYISDNGEEINKKYANKKAQESMDNRLTQIYKEQLQNDISKKISEKGYEVESCKVVAKISEDQSEIKNINLKVKRVDDVSTGNESDVKTTDISNQELKSIKEFLVSEYGVSEQCLRIN